MWGSNFWRAAVDIRGSALPSAAKSNKLKFGAIMESLPVQRVCLYACNQWAYADNCADAVDRLLIQRIKLVHARLREVFHRIIGYLTFHLVDCVFMIVYGMILWAHGSSSDQTLVLPMSMIFTRQVHVHSPKKNSDDRPRLAWEIQFHWKSYMSELMGFSFYHLDNSIELIKGLTTWVWWGSIFPPVALSEFYDIGR